MGLVIQKHETIGILIFDKNAMAYLPTWPTYPTLSYFWSKLDFPENLFSRIYTSQNLRSAEIAFPRKLIFQNLH